jgi:Carboxypeptidase regulatory-like domain/TonB dependent receptor
MRLRAAFFLTALGLSVGARLTAQSTFGSIVGVVSDASSSAVPDATIQVTNIDENTSRTFLTNTQGSYQALNLKPGKYRITAKKEGFGIFELSDVMLDARQERRADITLSVATVTETLEVTATASVVNTENGTISDTKGFQEVTELPVNYRGATTSPLGALVTVPGVQQDSNGGLSISGGYPSMIDFTLDGVSTINVRFNGANQNMYPSSELLSEFRVSSVNNNAEFAEVGDVTVTTKSGSNAFHGSLFEYFQNAALDATTYGASAKQAKVWNTFGGSLGGPVTIPRLYAGKNKTFFFADYEGNRHPGSTLEQYSVPTAAMRTGDLTGLSGNIVDPLTGLPFPNNQIPSNRISSVSSKVLSQVYPLPNFDSGSTFANYRTFIPTPITTNGYDVRIDHYLTPTQQIFGRWSWKTLDSSQVETLLPSRTVNETDQNLILSYNYSIKPALVNEFRFGLSRWLLNQNFPINGVQEDQSLGLMGLNLMNHPEAGAFPGFNFSDGTGFTPVGQGKVGNTFSRTYQFTDNLSWTKGKHSMKFGADVRFLQYQDVLNFVGSDDFGSFTFNQAAYSGNAFADFLLGLPSTNFFATTGPNLDQRAHHYGVYAQDEYRITEKLTLNFGLRWEFDPPFDETHGNITNFDLNTGNVIVPDQTLPAAASFVYLINGPCPGTVTTLPCSNIVSASSVGLPKGLHQYYYKNFDPRISFAWRPFGNKTVFRAGFGLFTMTSLGQLAWTDTGIHTTDARFLTNGNPPTFQFPQALPGNGGLTPSQIGSEVFLAGVSTKFRDPQSAQWNATIERELPSNYSLRVSYIGMNSYRLANMVDMNQVRPSPLGFNPSLMPYQNWSQVAIRQNLGFANYQSLNTELDHRFSHGLFLQASYNLAKNLTNAGSDVPSSLPSEVGSGAVLADRFDLRANRGNDYATRRHRGLISAIYQLPFGKGRRFMSKSGKLVDGIVGGWQLSTVTLLETGPWLTPITSPNQDQSGTNVLGRGAQLRPDRIGNGNISNPGPNGWFDINAFVPTPAGAGRIGNAGVGILEGPGTVTVAGGLSKNFMVLEHVKLRFEASFTNLLNHPNFAPPSTDITSPDTFGKTSSVQTAENGGNRTGQLALRLEF